MLETSNLRKVLLALEQRLLDPAVRRSPDLAAELLADDFVEIGSSGRTFDKTAILDLFTLEEQNPSVLTIIDFSVRCLSSSIVLATYQIPETRSKRSSLWKLCGSQWQIVFHQGTIVPG